MSVLVLAVGLVALQRLSELVVARRNTRRLLAMGGIEAGAAHYPLIVALHAGWLAVLLVAIPWDAPVLHLSFVALYLVLQPLRYWTIASLGDRWTTRIIVLPGAPRLRRGPYRYVTHPNYMIVVAEIALLPLAFGAWDIAAVFTVLNGALLTIRIRAENAAFRAYGADASGGMVPSLGSHPADTVSRAEGD